MKRATKTHTYVCYKDIYYKIYIKQQMPMPMPKLCLSYYSIYTTLLILYNYTL